MNNKSKFSPASAASANQFKLVEQRSPLTTSSAERSQFNVNRPPKRFYKSRYWLRRCFRYVCPSCCFCGTTYSHQIRHPATITASSSRGNRRRRRGRIKTICPPWNGLPFCCCVGGRSIVDSSEDICDLIRHCGTANGGDGDNIDIDQYVARFRSPSSSAEQSQLKTMNEQQQQQIQFAMTPQNAPQSRSSAATTPEVHKRGMKKLKKHFWNWNDSLKSNSDKFLESLEYDAIHGNGAGAGGGSKSNSLKKYRKITNCSFIEGICGSLCTDCLWHEFMGMRWIG